MYTPREEFKQLRNHIGDHVRGGVEVEHDGDGAELEHGRRRQPLLDVDELRLSWVLWEDSEKHT
jgi:hypothetical protein